ncbi:hypothetical protein I3842_16G033200 [Carya illinoinensis]|uniref:Uncharacterized protein n=1 Tax=Carya illinoinensis TaxID=32201 RepID=A0A922A6J6_CARIL|nr:hypothetical protein I3842_16G033200 [Carya illinoinensis]
MLVFVIFFGKLTWWWIIWQKRELKASILYFMDPRTCIDTYVDLFTWIFLFLYSRDVCRILVGILNFFVTWVWYFMFYLVNPQVICDVTTVSPVPEVRFSS